MTSTEIQDTDGDTLKDGEEIIIRKEYIPLTNQVRVRAIMLSDPRDEDTDHDGIEDHDDTDPLHKGMAGGIVGELSIVSFCDGKDLGHAFLVYKSLVHDYLDLTGFEYGFDVTINPQSEKLFSYSSPKIYEINSNEYVTFGAWADDAGQSLSYSCSDDIISLLGVHNTDGGIRFNQEAADIKNAHSAHDFCIDNYSVTNFVNENQLNILISYLNSNSYYHVLHHNCSSVARDAWNTVFGEYFYCSVPISGMLISPALGLYPLYVDLPAVLKNSIQLNENSERFYTIPLGFVEEEL